MTELLDLERMTQSPPNSRDAEQAALSAFLQNPELLEHAVGILQPEHFYTQAHGLIYKGMVECFELQAPIEPVAVADALRRGGSLDAAGGSGYVWDLLIGSNPNVSIINRQSLLYWVNILIDDARRRELINSCHDIVDSAHDRNEKTYLEQAENLLFWINEAFPDVTKPVNQDVIGSAMASLREEANAPGGITGLSTGFPSLDRITHGFQPFQLITVSARPGGGKSAFALNVAVHVVLKEKKPVLYISLEMTSAELMKRVIKQVADSEKDMSKFEQAEQTLMAHEHHFIFEDAAGLSLAAIQSRILKAKKAHPDLGLIVVDHIGLIASDPKASKNQPRAYEIQQITSRFKVLAKTVKVPIMQLAQMNRAIEGRQDKNKPQLSDLRDSGSIEMDSDIVLFTHIERDDERRPTGMATLTLAKQRDGVQAELPLLFVPHLTLFKEKPNYLR